MVFWKYFIRFIEFNPSCLALNELYSEWHDLLPCEHHKFL